MIWKNKFQAYSTLEKDVDRLNNEKREINNRIFQTVIAFVAIYGTFFLSNIAFNINIKSLWIILLIIGITWFILVFLLNIIVIILIKKEDQGIFKDIFSDSEIKPAISLSLFFSITAIIFIIISFSAIGIYMIDLKNICFVIIIIVVLIFLSLGYYFTRNPDLWIDMFRNNNTQSDKTFFTITKISQIIFSLFILYIIYFIGNTVLNYWAEGPLSINFIIFIIFIQLVSIAFSFYILFLTAENNDIQKKINKLNSKISQLLSNSKGDMKKLYNWYKKFKQSEISVN